MKRGKKRKKRKRGVASRKRVENQTTSMRGEEIAPMRGEEIAPMHEEEIAPMNREVLFSQYSKEKQQRMNELDDENRHIFEEVISRYELSSNQVLWLEYEFDLGLSVIADFEDATLDDLEDLWLMTYDSETISEMVEEIGESEAYWHASFELSNELGLSMINIDDNGNITGERIEY